jgi:hypothetical protein
MYYGTWYLLHIQYLQSHNLRLSIIIMNVSIIFYPTVIFIHLDMIISLIVLRANEYIYKILYL